MIEKSGKNLIYLISQPGAGSTLFQKIISNHSAISTLPETWFTLSYFAVLNKSLQKSIYSENTKNDFLNAFINKVGKTQFQLNLSTFITSMYNSALENDKKYFLEKTPRNHLIIKEIIKTLPESKIIIIIRNPISILLSYLRIIPRENWVNISEEFYCDLVVGLNNIYDLISEKEKYQNIHFSKYEDLIKSPEAELQNILKFIDLNLEDNQLQYNHDEVTIAGDNSGNIGLNNQPVNMDNWAQKIDTKEKQLMSLEYLNYLGEKKIETLGYNYKSIKNSILTKSSFKFQFRKKITFKKLINSHDF